MSITVHSTAADGMYLGASSIPDRFPGQGLPALTYTDGPPDTPLPSAWHRWQRQGDAWVVIEDHRGRVGWLADGTPQTVTELGPLPEGWSETAPEPTEDDMLVMALAAIEAEYTAKASVLRERLETILLVDGAVETAKRAALTVEWQAMQDARDAEILQLLGGI